MDEISLLIFLAIDAHSDTRVIFGGGKDGLADAVALTLSSVERGKAGVVHLRNAAFPSLTNRNQDAGVVPRV